MYATNMLCRNMAKGRDKDRGSLELGGENYLPADLTRFLMQTYGSIVSDENDVRRSFNYLTEMNTEMKQMKKLAILPFATRAAIYSIFSQRNNNFSFSNYAERLSK